MSLPADPGLLVRQLRRHLELAEKATRRIHDRVAGWGQGTPTEDEMEVVRVKLQDFYKPIEKLMERFVREANGEVPHGADSHARTLERSLPVHDRPGHLWSEDLRADLDELRKFRHFSHHGAYEIPLDPVHLKAYAERVERVLPRMRRDLDALEARLLAGR